MKHLITMEQYVIDIVDKDEHLSKVALNMLYDYAKLLQSKPTLGMFVATDDEGNVLEMPVNYDIWLRLHNNDVSSEKGTIGFLLHEEYQQALEKVIFEGWCVDVNTENIIRIVNGLDRIVFQDNIYFNGNYFIQTLSDLTKFKLKLK